MDALIGQNKPKLNKCDVSSGWIKVESQDGAGTSTPFSGSMPEAVLQPQSPRHLYKRRRLSQLLNKLVVQIQNNNNYPEAQWPMTNSPYADADNDAPLDLSLKPKPPQPQLLAQPPAFICVACGQSFNVHDRLAKHIASRHKGKTPESARAYECEICQRRFARSDMLTRHSRLHSGVKPYACNTCSQVFSRSDHLATHQRTHTGEKPYKCPMCPYAACRRDMITRHMRTHTRKTQTTA